MEFDFNVARTFGLHSNSGVACLSADRIADASSSIDPRRRTSVAPNDPSRLKKQLCEVIEEMGRASQIAQGLRQPVTNLIKLSGCPDQRVYIAISDRSKVIGLLKVGVKKLFVQTPSINTSIYTRSSDTGQMAEIQPLCVLDFYVHESCQRQGWGKKLFEYFLWQEKKSPTKLAYDRPSSKLLKFLDRHYGLKQYTPQTNNFVVYHRFFDKKDSGYMPSSCPVLFEEQRERAESKGNKVKFAVEASTSSPEKDYEAERSTSCSEGSHPGGPAVAASSSSRSSRGAAVPTGYRSQADAEGGAGSPELPSRHDMAEQLRGGEGKLASALEQARALTRLQEEQRSTAALEQQRQDSRTHFQKHLSSTYGSQFADPSPYDAVSEHFTRPAYVHYRDRQRQSSGVANLLSTHGSKNGTSGVGASEQPHGELQRQKKTSLYGSDFQALTGSDSKSMLSQQQQLNNMVANSLKNPQRSRTIL
ncbi:unnamed protein product [Amoebophrya sp. A120]|nr:unnamed protein product [Amoebophrya sp. A120]|eukprot:GSA120T00003805001.1